MRNDKRSFENFVLTKENNQAFSAAQVAAMYPGELYNPLYIYGGTGTGKTYLLYCIENYLREHAPDKSVLHTTAYEFSDDFKKAVWNNTLTEFRDRYRGADFLLIDDIRFLSGKENTTEEFICTFNALYETGRQIVIVGSRSPEEIEHLDEMEHLDERLVSRLGWGYTACTTMPAASDELLCRDITGKRERPAIPRYRKLDGQSFLRRKLEIWDEIVDLEEKYRCLEEQHRLEKQKNEQIVMNYKQACRTFMDHPDEIVKLFYRDLGKELFLLFKGSDIETIRKSRRGEMPVENVRTASDITGKFLDGRLHICHVWVRGSDFYLLYDSKAAKAAMYRSKRKGNCRHLYEMKYERESGKVSYGWIAEDPENIKETNKILRDHFEGRYTPVLQERKTAELEAPEEDPKPVSDSDKYNMILRKWDDILQYVKSEKSVSEVAYATWLKPLKPVMLLDGKLHIVIGLDVLAEYVEKQYGFLIIQGIEELAGFTVQLQFVPENVCSIAP